MSTHTPQTTTGYNQIIETLIDSLISRLQGTPEGVAIQILRAEYRIAIMERDHARAQAQEWFDKWVELSTET